MLKDMKTNHRLHDLSILLGWALASDAVMIGFQLLEPSLSIFNRVSSQHIINSSIVWIGLGLIVGFCLYITKRVDYARITITLPAIAMMSQAIALRHFRLQSKLQISGPITVQLPFLLVPITTGCTMALGLYIIMCFVKRFRDSEHGKSLLGRSRS